MCVNINKTPEFVTLAGYPQAIVHIDCDAFFTSCEEARNPALRGKALATGQERGIVSCANYYAKKLGVKRPMRLCDAKAICPGLIVLPSDYELYSIYSERMFSILKRFTPQVEEYSIDEAFCDLTGLRRTYRSSYEEIACAIKESVAKELGISVSVGLSLSKTLAKICSKQNKPNGFCAVPGYKLHDFLKNISLERVCGFGPNTTALLNKWGVTTVLGYIRRDENFAKKLLGKIGVELRHELRGEAVYKVSTLAKEKYLSISKTKTFAPISLDKEFIKAQLMRNLESAFIKLRRHKLSAKILIVYLRKADFTGQGLQARISRHSSATLDFTRICSQLFDEVFQQGCAYRATGVVLTDIIEAGVDTITIFDDPVKVEQLKKLSEATDMINGMYGKHTIHVASSHAVCFKQKHPRNYVAERKNTLLKGETFRKRLGIPLFKVGV